MLKKFCKCSATNQGVKIEHPSDKDILFAGFEQVLENLESPGILLWHFPGLESPGKGYWS